VQEASDLDRADDAETDAATDDAAGGARATADAIARRVRAQGARRVGQHVSVVETSACLDDLVVPRALRAQLDEIVGWQRGSWRVRWGMQLATDDSTGMGLTCLFAGKPGTGKTFAARCLAGELGLNLYRIDLSRVVSKYIGDTEKALASVFDEVEAGHGILLFDEADAIFGRRSEVKDAHDRYANIEVGYLLQRLESYEGVAVLTTNLQGNMDAAFVRRLRFILQFPEPDRELRLQLWERSLPSGPWREDDLDLTLLADRFSLNGGAIRNIGMAAAHLAAATPSGRVSTEHVLRATQRELQKTGRPADAAAFGPLGELVSRNGGRS
jgi:SpoVK/Ycf46/Vps4 family AAA+-type ATPase